ncbi:hypothetical protein GGX14DRAFT_499871 [Mycena pura]|uniref:F-box domain-containing protein n=1 Tax=Mycena pura TaxID=153505 RepID=A0AAD6YA82_9AGAR|nr:hypothetical protein GGX14DRAFT_499871 [Mycena pura]
MVRKGNCGNVTGQTRSQTKVVHSRRGFMGVPFSGQRKRDSGAPLMDVLGSAPPEESADWQSGRLEDLDVDKESKRTSATASIPNQPQEDGTDEVPARTLDADSDGLRELRARLVELNLGISRAKARRRGRLLRPNRLVEERNAIRRTLDSVAFYPILTLPQDIMEEIFYFCLPDDVLGDDRELVPDPHAAPLVLLRVCSCWRSIVLSTPRLWSSVRVNLRSQDSQHLQKSLSLLEYWLARARSRPLSVGVAYRNYEDNPSPERLIEVLTGSSERWQDVRLELPFKDLQRLNVIEGNVPMLRKLHIGPMDAYHGGMQGLHTVPITAFSEAPALREVHLVTGFPFTIELPLAQLRKLQVTSLSVCECLDILAASPSLVECSLSLRQSFDYMDATRIAPLQHLEVLILRTSRFHVDLLDCLTLPVLRELHFHVAAGAVVDECLEKIAAFLERSDAATHLKQIHFSGVIDLRGSKEIMELVQNGTRIGPPLDVGRRHLYID